MSDETPSTKKGIGREVLIGFLTAVVVGFASLVWNWASSGGVIHLLGGLTVAEVQKAIQDAKPGPPPLGITVADVQNEIAKHPGPQGPIGPPGPEGPVRQISSDVSWIDEKDNLKQFDVKCEYRWIVYEGGVEDGHMPATGPFEFYASVVHPTLIYTWLYGTLFYVKYNKKEGMTSTTIGHDFNASVQKRC